FEQLLPQKSTLIQQLETTPVEKREELLMTHIRSETAIVLGSKVPQRIKLRQSLFELGIDSLMAVELKNRLESSLGIFLSSTLLFDYPTLEGLVNYLIEKIIPMEFSLTSAEETSPAESQSTFRKEAEQISESEAEARLLKELEQMNY
ncbi:hypothetical protein C7B62_25245, partial [Pleurocapsa sp. CCALA 161]|uniref:acyl carrier protein n=1 Tax=Pleurocapsa sp. CCALA 161 TaxID=2107688 RepID=UPI000D46448D